MRGGEGDHEHALRFVAGGTGGQEVFHFFDDAGVVGAGERDGLAEDGFGLEGGRGEGGREEGIHGEKRKAPAPLSRTGAGHE